LFSGCYCYRIVALEKGLDLEYLSGGSMQDCLEIVDYKIVSALFQFLVKALKLSQYALSLDLPKIVSFKKNHHAASLILTEKY
jgi:hypothetical protein